MIIYNFFETLWTVFINLREATGDYDMFPIGLRTFLLLIGLSFSLFLVFHLFQSFGIYKMAKKRGFKQKWRAFFPFVNTVYMGKLAGTCNVFGRRMKRAGLYTMLAQISVFFLCALQIAAVVYLFSTQTLTLIAPNPEAGEYVVQIVLDETSLNTFKKIVFVYYNFASFLIYIGTVAYSAFLIILLMGLYKNYVPKVHVLLSFISVLVPLAGYIILFVVSHKNYVDYDEYMRKRREEFVRRAQQNGYGFGSPYGYNPYAGQNPYNQNPYGAPPQEPQKPKQPDEPFEEFSDDSDNPFID